MKLWKIKISIYLYIFTANKMSINSVHLYNTVLSSTERGTYQ